MKVLLQMRNHLLARIPVHSQERMVVTDAVQTLSQIVLRQLPLLGVARGKLLNSAFFGFDLSLDVTTRSTGWREDFEGSCGHELVPEHVEETLRFKSIVDGFHGLHTLETQHILYFGFLTVLWDVFREQDSQVNNDSLEAGRSTFHM